MLVIGENVGAVRHSSLQIVMEWSIKEKDIHTASHSLSKRDSLISIYLVLFYIVTCKALFTRFCTHVAQSTDIFEPFYTITYNQSIIFLFSLLPYAWLYIWFSCSSTVLYMLNTNTFLSCFVAIYVHTWIKHVCSAILIFLPFMYILSTITHHYFFVLVPCIQ